MSQARDLSFTGFVDLKKPFNDLTKVSAGLTDISGLAVGAVDLITAPGLSSGLSFPLT